ncbi:putative folylpolyglutamate synthase [Drosophila kikkawai]|uniref:Folylpolyglutamate synthase n=1 Tax=Drosophila kikkawai TaxID=30033 RepID=A0A6P4JCB2_DROKI|nr:putative folylpolyglutamate synthase [Drosophila kikkawai]
MSSLLPLIYRRPCPRLMILSSRSFFKSCFKAPQAKESSTPAITEFSKKKTKTQSQPSQSQASQSTQASLPQEAATPTPSQPPPSEGMPSPLGNQKPCAQPIIPDQRAKWMAKVSPEMQKKAKLAAGGGNPPPSQPKNNFNQSNNPSFGSPSQSSVSNFGGMPRNQQQQQQHQQKKQEPDDSGAFKGASSESQRQSWMNRMQGSQQKQAQWLKDMQAKQQAGRDIQAQKVQNMQQVKPAQTSDNASSAQSGSVPPAEPEKPEEQTPERLAYLDAIKQLNSYQALEPVAGRTTTKSFKSEQDPTIEQTLECLEKTGFSREQLKAIPVIQVAGSKGRGSTCGIVESILRCHGVKTGVLSSPHLFLTSERIRIDGEPLEEVAFTQLFWKINMELAQMNPPPSYNKILTVMAFHAFQKAGVEVAILEVGPGGASDATNVASHAQTIGITSLGWEQSSNLSNSLRDIAWAKAAIMKPEASIFTNVTQTECCEVLAQKANQIGVQLQKVPSFNDYIEGNPSIKQAMNTANYTMRLNGSLGIQLAYDFLRRHRPEYVVGVADNCTILTPGATRGIETFEQPGQFDFIKHDMYNVYLDSADTFESMMACQNWFYGRTRSSRQPKILLFNKVNEFNAKDLLTILRSQIRFEEAYFVSCPNFFEGQTLVEEEGKGTVWDGMEDLQRARRNAGSWRSLCEENGKKDSSQLSISINAFFDALQNKYGRQAYGMKSELDILVTGSRPLVAATIAFLRKMKATAKPWSGPGRR